MRSARSAAGYAARAAGADGWGGRLGALNRGATGRRRRASVGGDRPAPAARTGGHGRTADAGVSVHRSVRNQRGVGPRRAWHEVWPRRAVWRPQAACESSLCGAERGLVSDESSAGRSGARPAARPAGAQRGSAGLRLRYSAGSTDAIIASRSRLSPRKRCTRAAPRLGSASMRL